MSKFEILACQIEVPQIRSNADRDQHLDRLGRLIDEALLLRSADLVVLPELATLEYSRECFTNLDDLAEDARGPSHTLFTHLAARHRCHFVYGFARRGAHKPFISSAIIGPDGEQLGCYDKIHLCHYGASMEPEFFTAGSKPVIFDIGPFRAAPLICYDLRFPALARTVCIEHGATLLLHMGAYSRDASYASWRDFVVTRAMENQVFMLSLNRAGPQNGGSMLCPPWVDDDHPVIRMQRGEELARFSLDHEEIGKVRRDYAILRDRRSDIGPAAILDRQTAGETMRKSAANK